MKLAPQEDRTYLLTAITAERRALFRAAATAELFVATLQDGRAKGRFEVHAFVAMPDHVHVLLTPAVDCSLEKAVQYIKGGFSFRLKSRVDVWQRGYDNRRILDGAHFDACQLYIEKNPVRAGLAGTAMEFLYSSCGRMELVDPRPLWMGRG